MCKKPCVDDFQPVYATARLVKTAAPVAYLEPELLTVHALQDTAEPLAQVCVYNYRLFFIFDSGYINTVFILPCFSLQPVSVMVHPVKMAARAVCQREELLTAYACPDTVVEHALVSVMSQ